jgi:uncharacterized protein (DUF58 family)
MWLKDIFKAHDNIRRTMLDEEAGAARNGVSLSPSSMRQLNRLQLNASRYLPGYSAGLRASVRRMPAAYFQEHRMYVPGDDIRFLDWKASARHEHIFIKQGEQPKEATVYILLDCSASMGWGEPTKASAALQLSAGLGYLALSHSDRLVFICFSDRIRNVLGPIHGKGQYPGFLNHLKTVSFSGTANFLESARVLRKTLINRGGLVLMISDFIGCSNLVEVVKLFPAPTWDFVALHLLHPEELDPERTGDFELVDIESSQTANYDLNKQALESYRERIEIWKNNLARECAENNSFYTLINSGWKFDGEILPHLRKVGLVKPI